LSVATQWNHNRLKSPNFFFSQPLTRLDALFQKFGNEIAEGFSSAYQNSTREEIESRREESASNPDKDKYIDRYIAEREKRLNMKMKELKDITYEIDCIDGSSIS
jgi:hypothetical protein